MLPEMDSSLAEVLQRAWRDDPQALTCRTLWACGPLLESGLRCQEDIDFRAVIQVLRLEARLRGVADR